jgi:acetyltransferase-like isoleucine patch superfamily enzyme
MSKLHRLRQVVKYGWQHAGQISQEVYNGEKRLSVFLDIFACYRKYGMWSNQYLKEKFWELDKSQRASIGHTYQKANEKKEAWVKDFYENRKFYIKYGNIKYEKESLRAKRNEAYTKRYNAGKNLSVENDVNISRQHYLNGTISIGDNVLLAKHVFIDYSGDVIVHDNVGFANGVIVETHTHPIEKNGVGAEPGRLEIERGVKLLSGAYIADTCHFIGRYARIGAGTYIRGNVLPYSIMIGNPAKIVGFMYSPDEVEEFEKKCFPEGERTDLEKYRQDYKKFFIDRRKEIKAFLQK